MRNIFVPSSVATQCRVLMVVINRIPEVPGGVTTSCRRLALALALPIRMHGSDGRIRASDQRIGSEIGFINQIQESDARTGLRNRIQESDSGTGCRNRILE